jgi:hypothetical protein
MNLFLNFNATSSKTISHRSIRFCRTGNSLIHFISFRQCAYVLCAQRGALSAFASSSSALRASRRGGVASRFSSSPNQPAGAPFKQPTALSRISSNSWVGSKPRRTAVAAFASTAEADAPPAPPAVEKCVGRKQVALL